MSGAAVISQHAENSALQVVQLTDSHLGARAGSCLLGLDTDYSLQQVLATLRSDGQPIDLLLATGDLSNDGSATSLQRFQRMTAGLAPEQLWLPGNHDELASMASVASEQNELRRAIRLAGWQIIMLNSQVPRQVGGALADAELDWLGHQLSAFADLPTLVCLHHHLLPVGCDWLDQQRVANADDVLALLASHSQVRAVSSGHVHQDSEQRHQHLTLYTSPSTCIQFAPDSPGFRLDRRPPGYRRFALYPDGHFTTGVLRATNVQMDIDFSNTAGY